MGTFPSPCPASQPFRVCVIFPRFCLLGHTAPRSLPSSPPHPCPAQEPPCGIPPTLSWAASFLWPPLAAAQAREGFFQLGSHQLISFPLTQEEDEPFTFFVKCMNVLTENSILLLFKLPVCFSLSVSPRAPDRVMLSVPIPSAQRHRV